DELMGVTSNLDLQIIEKGKKVELRAGGLSKEHACLRWLTSTRWDFVLVISDGLVGERLFEHFPKNVYSITVGKADNRTDYYVKTQKKMREFLEKLANKKENK
ncbi:MAG: hypothetical protein SVM86_05440, partial [Candidatus Cloacimonadota bacterium]|nr:hypothetical protein [Candidatus Cloacimonadota bacterium]